MSELSNVQVGTELPTIEQHSSLMTSVMYAAASGDYNPLHYDESVASQISPTGGIIAHGMFSMGLASRLLTEFAGDPERVAAVEVRFTKPWPLNSTTTFGGKVKEITDDEIVVALFADNENGTTILKGTGRIRR